MSTNKPNLSKDGSFIDFKQSENVPTTAKKFRQSAEIQGFYSFVYDNGLQQEAFDILTEILIQRKAAAKAATAEANALKQAPVKAAKPAKTAKVAAKPAPAKAEKSKGAKKAKSLPKKPTAKTKVKPKKKGKRN